MSSSVYLNWPFSFCKKYVALFFGVLPNLLFSQAPDSWTQMTDMPATAAARDRAISFSINGKGYVGLGSDNVPNFFDSVWEYDPATNSWTQKADIPPAYGARNRAFSFVLNGKGYFGTGWNGTTYYQGVCEYDPVTNVWTGKNNFAGGARYGASAFVIGQKAYVVGGKNATTVFNDVYEYNFTSDTWTTKTSIPAGRYSGVAFTIGGKGYCGTGYNAAYLNDFWRYNPATNSWAQIPDLPGGPRALAASFSLVTRGFVAGGSDATSILSDVWEYNLFTDSWNQKNPLPFGKRFGASTFVIGNTAYMGLGNNNPTVFKDLWQYNPSPLISGKFQKSYGGTNDDTDPERVCFGSTTADGGFIIASSTKSFSTNKEIYLVRTNQIGDTLWTRTYSTPSEDVASSVRQTLDGGYIIAGLNGPSFINCDALLLKTNSAGNAQWVSNISGTGIQRANYAEQLSSGEYVVTGRIDGTLQSAGILKLNSNGGVVVGRSVNKNGGVNSMEGYYIEQTNSGNFSVSGEFLTGSNLDVLMLFADANISTSMNLSFYGSTGTFADERTVMKENQDGTYMLCGTTNMSTGHGLKDFYLTKLNAIGNTVLWSAYYGGTADDVARAIEKTPDGGYVISGFTKSIGSGGEDAFLMKVNSAGAHLWTHTYGGTLDDKANSLSLTPDGGFALFGETKSFSAGGTDIYFIRTDSLGKSDCNETAQNFPAPITLPAMMPTGGIPNFLTIGTAGGPSMQQKPPPSNMQKLCISCSFPITKGKTNIKCFGANNGTAFVNPTGGASPFTYFWSTGQTTSSVTGLSVGTYTVTAIDANQCSVTDTIKIFQAPPILINTSNDSVLICTGGSATIGANATGGNPPHSYTWSPATGLSCVSCQSPVANPTASTPYVISVSDTAACIKKDTIHVIVLPVLNANAGNDQTICAGNSVTIGSAPASGVNYFWSPGTGLNNTSIANPVANPVLTTTYVVTASNAGGCTQTDYVIVQVVPSPTVSLSSSTPTTICNGTTTILSAFSNSPNYLWNTGASTSSITVSPTTTTSYTVAAIIGSCYTTTSLQLTVVQTPTVTISSSGSNTICTGSNVLLSGTGTGNYLWSNGSTATSITVTSTTTGTFTYSLTVTSPGNTSCLASDSYSLTFISSPAITVSSTYTTICAGFSVDTLSAAGGTNYYWIPGGQTTASIVVSPDNPTTYTVVVSNSTGCTGTSTFFLNVTPGFNPPQVIPQNFSYCAGDTILPVTATPTPPATIGWVDILGNTLGFGNSYQPPQTLGVGTYTVLCVQGIGLQCLSYATPVTLTIHALPKANAGNDITICPGTTAHLLVTGGTNYLWTPSTYLNDPLIANPSANPDSSVYYSITVTDANNCKDIDSVAIYVNVNDTCGIHIYNVLTPNGDGNNDVWWIDGIGAFPENTVNIYNRWGTLVWGKKNYDNKKVVWRGQNEQNQPLPSGTYYYAITINGKIYSKWVELIR